MTEKIPPVLSEEEIVEDMVRRYRKWDSRGTPDPVIMNKILVNIKPLIIQQAKEEERREIFEKIEEDFEETDTLYVLHIAKFRWQALKSKYPKG